jgi:conjugal transfer pilus assembly protein TraD
VTASPPAASATAAAAPVPGQLTLGIDGARRPVRLTDQQLAAHGVILGATGSGKSTSLLSILCQQIAQGAPVIAIDLKGSLQFASALESAAAGAGRPFRVWRPEGPAHWNPLAHGDATELKDKLISSEKFTEPHYQRAAERYLQTTLQVLQAAAPERPVTLAGVVGALEVDTLKKLLVHCPKELMARVGPYITQLNRDQQSAALGIQSRLAVISESAVGAWLQPGPEPIDLRHTLTGGNDVVLFSLNASRYGKLSAQIAAMVVQDIIAISGHRLGTSQRDLALVALDEFSALDADNILHLLARAREAGISVLLSTQEMADLERLATGFRDQVLGNSGFLLAHRQNVPDSAELIAKMVGTRTVWQNTYQTEDSLLRTLLTGDPARKTGRGTRKAVEEFQIHPNTIKSLSTGQAVLLTKIPTSAATPLTITAWTPGS